MTCTIVLDCETRPHPEDFKIRQEPVAPAALALEAMMPAEGDYGWTALVPALATVTCVGLIHIESGKEKAFTGPEAIILSQTAEALQKVTQVVTFNGRGFDLPLLICRMAARKITVPPRLRRAAQEPRYALERSVDMREAMTFHGAVRGSGTSLRAFCLAYGIEDPKANGDGKDSWALDEKDLAAYCLGDCRALLELYRRWKAVSMID